MVDPRRGRAFTLVEMMIVVAIVMVLAAIAIPLVTKYQLKAKESELAVNVDGIQAAEMGYIAAHDAIYNIDTPYPTNTGGYPWCPSGKAAWPWAAGSGFDGLGFRPDGAVRGSYAIPTDPFFAPFWLAKGVIDVDGDEKVRACEATDTESGCLDTAEICCFVGGTRVTLADGSLLPIEEIQVGDLVLAYDEAGAIAAYPVEATLHAPPRPLFEVELADGTLLQGTARHPVFTGTPGLDGTGEREAWTPLAELVPGDVVWSIDGEDGLAPRRVVRVAALRTKAPAFNLTVAGAHTFFVGGVLVHNKSISGIASDPTRIAIP